MCVLDAEGMGTCLPLCFQRFAHFTGEVCCGKGLANERKWPAANRLKDVIGVAGHVKHLDRRHGGINLLGKLRACHTGHHHVGEDKTRRRGHALQALEGIHPVTCLLNGIAGDLEQVTHGHSNIFIIFDQ